MIKLPKFDETTIDIADGVITITQIHNYSAHTVSIPVSLWANFAYRIDAEIEASPFQEEV